MPHLTLRTIAIVLLAALSAPALADPGGPGQGRGHHKHNDEDRGDGYGPRGGAYTERYLDGLCMVERRWDKHGRYRQERRCREPAAYGPRYGVQYAAPPAPIVIPAPAIVIQPPALVIRP